MRLILDTETSGLRRKDLPLEHPSQPRMVQIAAVLFDAKWRVTAKQVCLIRPDGWEIEAGAQAVHGITVERAARHGVSVLAAMVLFKDLCASAVQIIGHNMEFDRGVIVGELHRLKSDGLWWSRKGSQMVCTMEASTRPCGIPGQYGLKYPSLEEAMAHFRPEMAWTSRHDAEDDLMATALVAQSLEERGLLPEPWKRPTPVDDGWRSK